MTHRFEDLEPEYSDLLASMTINRPAVVEAVAHHLLPFRERYAAVEAKTGVPVVWLAAINERESSSNFTTYLGNGQSLRHRTTIVPRGRGPFPTWEAGAIDALHVDRIELIKDWTWERACFECELYNGFGSRAHGIHSPYLWAGSNHYRRGKYVSDHVWDPNHVDTQLGCVPIMKALVALAPDLDLKG